MQTASEEFSLLPGEEHASAPDQDAQHWVIVYSELIEFCELILTRPEQDLEAAHLRRRITHYRRRLRCWQEQLGRTSS